MEKIQSFWAVALWKGRFRIIWNCLVIDMEGGAIVGIFGGTPRETNLGEEWDRGVIAFLNEQKCSERACADNNAAAAKAMLTAMASVRWRRSSPCIDKGL